MEEIIKEKKICRVCNGKNLKKVLSLGSTPPANAFLKKEELNNKEDFFPLELNFCKDCTFVQLTHTVSPELLFKNYVYVSSTSPVFIAHFQDLADKVIKRFKLPKNSLVVDIGSNDGILLRPFKEQGMNVLGIDPAEKIATLATKNGIETLPLFFNKKVAGEIVNKRGHASIVTATSVFSHVDDLDEFVSGVKELLADDGVFIIEVYYLSSLLENNLFDTIYHEHLSYFTVKTITTLLNRLGLQVFSIETTDTHGGSLRVFAQKNNGPHQVDESIKKFMLAEENKKLYDSTTYFEFARKIDENKRNLLNLLDHIKSSKKTIVGYGAPAKGNTLLNYFEIDEKFLDYIVDDSPWKQGLYTPGTHIPVVSSEELSRKRPDYILILAWNYASPIMKKYKDFNRFIIPVPTPRIVENVVEQDLNTIVEAIGQEAKKLEGKTILITGGSGFIGSYIVAALDALNANMLKTPCKVMSVDNHIVGSRKNNLLKEIRSEHIDFVNHNVCEKYKIEQNVDYIISAAGVASPVYYKKFPIETIDGTILGIKNSLELAIEKKSKSILYFSSSEIYGDPDPNFIPTPETYKGNVSCTGDRSCYDESKRVGETICMAYHRVHNVPVKIVRPFNLYGPGMKGADYRVVPTFLSQGIKGETLTVHDKGNQTRSFCYITDAIVAIFKILLSDKNGEVYNIGNSSEEINMLALAEIISQEVFENKAKIQLIKYPDAYPQDEPRRRCPSLNKIKSDLGYEPFISLRTGLKRTATWLRDNMN